MALQLKQQLPVISGDGPATEVRCDCGCLLARKVGDTLELKCRRCKRVVAIAKIISSDRHCECDDG